jgi:hypothetical protein
LGAPARGLSLGWHGGGPGVGVGVDAYDDAAYARYADEAYAARLGGMGMRSASVGSGLERYDEMGWLY